MGQFPQRDGSWQDCTPAPGGRRFAGRRRIRLGDVTRRGRLRLDALTRYTQDVSDDDTTDAGLDIRPAWVVRRTTVAVLVSARLGEDVTITTFCSGLGRRWAERHLRIEGDGGARYEVSTLWICIDPTTGRPIELTEQFRAIYGPAAGGRTVTTRLTHPKPPSHPTIWTWPLRAVDFDVFGHVNNAAYWAAVEQVLDAAPQAEPFLASVEYGAGLGPVPSVDIASEQLDGERRLWWLTDDGPPAASALVAPGHASSHTVRDGSGTAG